MPGGSVERMISSNRRWAIVFSMAFIGSGSPRAPQPWHRSCIRSFGVELDFASAIFWSRVWTSAALGTRSGSTGKAQLSALKSSNGWVVCVAAREPRTRPGRVISDRGSCRAPGRQSLVGYHEVPMHHWLLSRSAKVGRCRRWPSKDEVRESEPAMPATMTQIMGTAVTPPPELARGADVAMATAWTTPRTAEAAPATCRAWSAASALALPKTNAWTAIRTTKPAQVSTSGVPRVNTPTSKPRLREWRGRARTR